jgi:hypothetical protein
MTQMPKRIGDFYHEPRTTANRTPAGDFGYA